MQKDEETQAEWPKVSIIIPTFDCSQSIVYTLESILHQKYPDFEMIIVDAGSSDRTLEIVKSYYDNRIRICSVAEYSRYEMLNKGISLAKGKYLNFLFPGDFYLFDNVLTDVMEAALKNHSPQLVFGSCLLRDSISYKVKVLNRSFNRENLRQGKQPTNLQSCWFEADTFRKTGKFNRNYKLRGGYDFLCRFLLYSQLRFVSIKRVYVDFSYRAITKETILLHFRETFKVIRLYFGWINAFKWLFIQRDLKRYLKLSLRGLKSAFIGE